MDNAKAFYDDLHASQESYSGGTYHMDSLYGHRVVRDWMSQRGGRSLKVLDVGCGKGVFIRGFSRAARERWKINACEITGIDLVRSPNDQFEEISREAGHPFEFVQQDLDGRRLPFADGSFDLICCNHVLEHVFQTEILVREMRRVISNDGLCLISVPNLACWTNRILLLFGGQPLGTEVGTEKITYGFWPSQLQKKLEGYHPAGHIRDFTPRALRDLTYSCGFRTEGWWKQNPDLLARLGKWAGRAIAVLLRPI